MSNITQTIKAMIENSIILSPENKAAAIEHLEQLTAAADKIKNRELEFTVKIDREPLYKMLADMDSMHKELTDKLIEYAKANGFFAPPAGREWIPMSRVTELKNREAVIVTDGKTWGLSKYNIYRPATPFPMVYDVCEWEVMGSITHFRRMNAIALPDGSFMDNPNEETKVLPVGTTTSPCCKARLEWNQVCGMHLYDDHKGVEAYEARCGKCHQQHWVKR